MRWLRRGIPSRMQPAFFMNIRAELLMIERAIRNRWPMSEQSRSDALRLVVSVLADPDSSVRARSRATSIRDILSAADASIAIT